MSDKKEEKPLGVEEQLQQACKVIDSLAREARKAITAHGAWQQEYNGNEVLAVVALYQATMKVVYQKERALTIATQFF